MTIPYVQDYSLTLNKFLEHAARWRSDAGVITARGNGETSRTGYGELLERSRSFSAGLLALGIRPGDRVATLAWNTQEHVEAWYGISGIGAVIHTLNPRLSVDTLGAMVRLAECRLLVVAANLASIAVELVRIAPSIERIIVIDDPVEVRDLAASVPVSLYASVCLDEDIAWGDFDEASPAGLCFTSGTTGDPKGVVYTHRSSYLHTLRILQADVIAPTANDNILMVVPMFHANGWGLPFAAPAVGASLVLPGRHLDGQSLAALISSANVTVAAAVPTVWLGLVDHLDKVGGELPSLKRIIVGGAPISEQLMDRIERRIGAIVQTSWGMTELTPLGAIAPASLAKRDAASAGRIAVGVDLLLKDSEGRALPSQRNVEGRLHVRGQSVVQRYYGHSTPAVDADGWFDTGDLARIQSDGALHITGRAKDLIKSGGEWINPAEIEAIIARQSGVAEVAVIARADPKWGERPVLIVKLLADAINDDDLLQPLRPLVPAWWIPDAIVRVATMPLAPTGKIDKKKLRAEFG
ncbi:MAG TPA: AMP-binding protein [Hyphomonadaceae bacterium]|nr:AMP-binding protein [Hyphomonadaceae bacterium]